MEKQAEVITINTDAGTTPQVTGSLIEGRKNVVSSLDNFYEAKVTIYVQAYNRLEKTKACIESILKYTGDIVSRLPILWWSMISSISALSIPSTACDFSLWSTRITFFLSKSRRDLLEIIP